MEKIKIVGLAFFLAVLVLLTVACQPTIVSKESPAAPESKEVKTESTVASSGLDGWCKAGADWKMAASSEEGKTNVKWIIKGLISSGEYRGLCHVEYTAESPQGSAKIDYYFAKDGESGYMVMDINGQKLKQEWHKS